MPVRIRIGRRILAPRPLLTVLVIALCVVFIGLGRWQWQRGELRAAQWTAFERGTERVLPLGTRDLEDVERFQQVSVTGRYLADRQFLLDNRTHAGRAGYEVLTPLALEDGRVVLVNRGWVPFTGFRDRLPDVAFAPAEPLTVIGRVTELPAAGLATGRVAPAPGAEWPKVASFPDAGQLGAALGEPIEPRILLLDPEAPHGYVREWQPPGTAPATHWSYAIQWWAFAALALVLWGVASLKRPEEQPEA